MQNPLTREWKKGHKKPSGVSGGDRASSLILKCHKTFQYQRLMNIFILQWDTAECLCQPTGLWLLPIIHL